MSSVTTARTLPVAALLVAVGAVVWLRNEAPTDEPPLSPAAPAATLPSTEASPRDAPLTDSAELPAAAKLRELNEMSETYRNTTFLIAIRDSGFVCNELLGAYGGVNDSTTWTATCSQMLAYTVSVASSGALHVEPMLQHLDLMGPPVTPRENGSEPLLPPQRLLPPRMLPPRR